MNCRWEDCLEKMDDVKEHLMSHIEKQSQLKCMWKDCPRYGEVQASKHTLLAHARRHTGERPFECHICGKDYTRSDPLKKHLARHEAVEQRNRSLISKIDYLSSLLTEHLRESLMIMNDIETVKYNIEIINDEIIRKTKVDRDRRVDEMAS